MIIVERDVKTIHFKRPSQSWGIVAWKKQSIEYKHKNVKLTFGGNKKEEMVLTVYGIINNPHKFNKSLLRFYSRSWEKSVSEFVGEILFETKDGILLLGGQVLLQKHKDKLESMIGTKLKERPS